MMDADTDITNNLSQAQSELIEFPSQGFLQQLLNVLALAGTISLIYNLAILIPKNDWLTIAFYLFLFVGLILATLGRRIPYPYRVTIVSAILFLLGAFTIITNGLQNDGVVFLLGFVFVNTILLNQRAGIISLAINAITITFVGIGYQFGFLSTFTNDPAVSGPVAQWIKSLFSTTLVGGLMVAAGSTMMKQLEKLISSHQQLSTTLQLERKSFEEAIMQRTQDLNLRATHMEAAARVARNISSFNDLDSLVTDTIEMIRDQFGYYHVGLFLVDEKREFAVLRAAAGEAGRRMLARNHRLKIGEEGLVGNSIEKNEARISLDVGLDAIHFWNPDLPNTHSEMALPLRSDGKTIGSLDVQSDVVAAFGPDDIRTLETIADQLALAIQKVNLLAQLKQSLTEIEASYQQYTRKSWNAHLSKAKRNYAFRYRRQQIEMVDEGYVEVKKALEANQAVISTQSINNQTQTLVAIPIKLRGEPLGVINLRFDASYVPQDTVDLLENTAARLALALDNARLLEELQQKAERERQIGSIVSKVRSRADIDSILRTTAEELGRSLGVAEVLVQLKDM
ncbi:MAG TPA: GAF domain-containing protein [Longilinea sp.]|nr:GAF domain-containing protein [Longilinea sp.]